MPLRVLETRSLTRWDGRYRVRPDDKPITNDQGLTAVTGDRAFGLLLPAPHSCGARTCHRGVAGDGQFTTASAGEDVDGRRA